MSPASIWRTWGTCTRSSNCSRSHQGGARRTLAQVRGAADMFKANLQYLLQRERVTLIDEFDKLLVGLVVARVV